MELLLLAYFAPTAYMWYQLYMDRKISKDYLDSEIRLGKDGKGKNLNIRIPNKENYLWTAIPVGRYFVYHDEVSKSVRTIEVMNKIYNNKIKCGTCSIVSAYWEFKEKNNYAECPRCKNETSINVIEGEDAIYPFYKKKTKKEIKNMLSKKVKNNKENIREEQYQKYEELKEKNKEIPIDISK